MAEIATERNSTSIFPAQFMTTVQEAIAILNKDFSLQRALNLNGLPHPVKLIYALIWLHARRLLVTSFDFTCRVAEFMEIPRANFSLGCGSLGAQHSSKSDTPHARHSKVHKSGNSLNRCVLRISCMG